jgi:RimJ/RimL family protein N-acetyltransferase
MKIITETERFILREWTPDDAEFHYELNLHPEVIQYTGNVAFKSVEEAREFLENYDHYKVAGMGRWLVIDKETGEKVGWCGLKNEDGFTDLGYRFFKKHWGKGYATETALACLKYGFEVLELDEIIATALKDNPASYRVMQKIGMKFWKIDTRYEYENVIFYKINKEEFRKTAQPNY